MMNPVATVDQNGLVTAVGRDLLYIVAHANGGDEYATNIYPCSSKDPLHQ